MNSILYNKLYTALSTTFEKELISEMSKFEILEFPAGVNVLEKVSGGFYIPFVIEGKVIVSRKVAMGSKIDYYPINQYEACVLSITAALRGSWGEMMLLNENQRASEVYTEVPTKILAITPEKADEWSNKYPSWRKYIMKLYQMRLRELINQNEVAVFQKDRIQEQNKKITDSIQYAKRIQRAVFPSDELLNEICTEHFIYFKPRDIVSGDFYWISKTEDKIIIVAADATGHGVPGAFMSMLGIAYLNELKDVSLKDRLTPNLVLERLRDKVKNSLKQTGKDDEAKDGMDIALCMIDIDKSKIQFSGAHNPIYIFRKDKSDYSFIELKPDKQPIGIHIKEHPFTNQEFQIQPDDTIYMFSDGYADQFGGIDGGKFKSKRFKHLLMSIQDKSMSEQKEIIDSTLIKWKGNKDQVDDILIIGIRL
jgi:serine phosphatase RsbU (regulator of sigma subunit)